MDAEELREQNGLLQAQLEALKDALRRAESAREALSPSSPRVQAQATELQQARSALREAEVQLARVRGEAAAGGGDEEELALWEGRQAERQAAVAALEASHGEAEMEELRGSLASKVKEADDAQRRLRQLEEAHAADLAGMAAQLQAKEEALRTATQAQAPAQPQADPAALRDLQEQLAEAQRQRAAAEEGAIEARRTQASQAAELEQLRGKSDDGVALKEKLRSATRRRAEAQSQLAEAQTQLDDVRHELAVAQVTAEETAAQLKEAAGRAEEAEEAHAGCAAALEEQRAAAAAAEAARAEAEAARAAVAAELDALRESSASAAERLEAAEKQVQETRTAVADQALEHKIANRRHVQLIKELKAQLAKERAKTERLSEDVANLERGLQTQAAAHAAESEAAEEAAARLAAQAEAAAANAAASARPAGLLARVAQKARSPSAAASAAAPPVAPVAPRPAAAGAGGADQDGVKRALAQRLEQLLAENEAVREKVAYLEANVQTITEELYEKRVLLRHFTGSTRDSDEEAAVAVRAATSPEARETMESLLETTLLENIRLKRDLKAMGAQVMAGGMAAAGDGDGVEYDSIALGEEEGGDEEGELTL